MYRETTMCQHWVERDKKVIAPCQHLSYYPLVVAKAEGDLIYDEDGNVYIDFMSSAASLNLGSSFPYVMEAVKKQLDLYTQFTSAYTYNASGIAYAERLTSVYPQGVAAKVAYSNSGSDANDGAIKFARAYTGRSKIITFINGYHGNTYGSASLSAVTTRMRSKMGPFLPEVYHFPFFGSKVPDDVCEKECLAEIERAFGSYLPAEEVAAVIIEPIQGDAGMIVAHKIFMKKLYALCQKHGILFIAEEVQQGFFRTGKWFSIEHFDIVPDGIVLGKSVGGGFPLGVFMAKSEIMDALPAPGHLFTLGGNALACAAGAAAFDYMETKGFQEALAENERIMLGGLEHLRDKFPTCATEIRGMGMSRGLALTKKDPCSGEVAGDDIGTYKVLYRCYEKGLMVISLANNVLRIQPPLTITPEHLQQGFAILEEAMGEYVRGEIPDEVMQFRNGW